MDSHREDWEGALQSMHSMIARCEKAQEKFASGTSQHTLLQNRMHALRVSAALIGQKLTGADALEGYGKEDYEKAEAPILSLIHKSEKARQKLSPGTWQDTTTGDNLKALYIASSLLTEVLERP